MKAETTTLPVRRRGVIHYLSPPATSPESFSSLASLKRAHIPPRPHPVSTLITLNKHKTHLRTLHDRLQSSPLDLDLFPLDRAPRTRLVGQFIVIRWIEGLFQVDLILILIVGWRRMGEGEGERRGDDGRGL